MVLSGHVGGPQMKFKRGWVIVAALLSVLAVTPSHAAANELTEITIPAKNGEIPEVWKSYAGQPKANVLLPDNYDPSKQYPLLMLLAGASSSYQTWSFDSLGRIKTTAAGFPGIIVMPEGGTGYYADWWNKGERGTPRWESYYMDEVIPQIVRRYRIRPERRYHALAGVSMGGLGTAYLGGRLPGFFGSIGIISGVVDMHLFPGMMTLASLVPLAVSGQPSYADAVYGPENDFYAMGHEPTKLAANLQHTRVYMAAGNGVPTDDGEPNGNNPATDTPTEISLVRPGSDHYADALEAAGVDYKYEPHDGIHDFANFRKELRDAISWDFFKPVAEHSDSWTNDTVATHGKLWQFRYDFEAPPNHVVTFRRSGSRINVSAAGTPVTLTTDGGCVIRTETPGSVKVPAKACTKLKVKVTPRKLRTGKANMVKVTVGPEGSGAKVKLGKRSVTADAAGVAYLSVCSKKARELNLKVTDTGFPGTAIPVKVRGPQHSCSGRKL